MKYILFALVLLFSCKKEDKPTDKPTHVIKYEASGECCDLQVSYRQGTLKTHTSTNNFSWDYTFTAQVGDQLEISASSDNTNGFSHVMIYQDGALLVGKNGFGTPQVTAVVK